ARCRYTAGQQEIRARYQTTARPPEANPRTNPKERAFVHPACKCDWHRSHKEDRVRAVLGNLATRQVLVGTCPLPPITPAACAQPRLAKVCAGTECTPDLRFCRGALRTKAAIVLVRRACACSNGRSERHTLSRHLRRGVVRLACRCAERHDRRCGRRAF